MSDLNRPPQHANALAQPEKNCVLLTGVAGYIGSHMVRMLAGLGQAIRSGWWLMRGRYAGSGAGSRVFMNWVRSWNMPSSGRRRNEAMRLLIIQPWFTGKGHPAQSLLNTASAIGKDERLEYLVSFDEKLEVCKDAICRLERLGVVHRFKATSRSGTGSVHTILAVLTVVWLRLKGVRYQRLFFFDANIPMLALMWPFFAWALGVERVSILPLCGPEEIGNRIKRYLVQRFVRRADARVYLRTEELAHAWVVSFDIRADCLPSLEIPVDPESPVAGKVSTPEIGSQDGKVSFGIVGQIRPGKGLDWLVPLFKEHPSLGELTVAGALYDESFRRELAELMEFEGFMHGYLSEEVMLGIAAKQDYLLMLYGEGWDPRMESAVLYLAARVNRPVIVYDRGWSGRKVREYGCGLLASDHVGNITELLHRVPRAGSVEYSRLLDGIKRFRNAHSASALRMKVLNELTS